ncbi:class I SAM-dependent rRNA methyltransferase [Acidipila rosea]|uniref:SAM-dependent methyltransferase n=1 Tax=Acidipila rosea TaxID=768535 RepID=A0A4R1KZ47_9BACT|nr:class I SAM-dependent rRNA methyltransferase [Acidipila rosea]TCK70816.1 SAM-dependent methyltransferase [Acidipila rosea]
MRKANQNEEVEAPARRENGDPVAAVISRRAADRLRAGHVWVYQSDVVGLNFEQENAPSLVSVTDQRGIFLGVGLYSASSQIALRVVSREALDEAQWLAMLQERLRLAIRRRRSMLDVENDACRLAFSEADELPGLVADKYGEIVVLQLLAKGLDNQPTRDAVMAVLRDELLPATIVERPDPRIRELEQLSTPADGPLYARDAAEPLLKTIFRLNDLSFHFDVTAGQKTGAFLDQRENYAAAARYAHGESLDVCTYQGGFALHLATVCSRVTGVDVSRAALEVAEQNLALNRDKLVAGVDWLEANAFDLLRDWSDAGSTYDTIVLDPPAFAKSKRATEGALRGYKELNLRAIKMLRPEGVLVTCSCSHHVSLADFQAVVAAAAADAGRRVTLLERRGAAADHPFVLTLPETEYLKCLICRVS